MRVVRPYVRDLIVRAGLKSTRRPVDSRPRRRVQCKRSTVHLASHSCFSSHSACVGTAWDSKSRARGSRYPAPSRRPRMGRSSGASRCASKAPVPDGHRSTGALRARRPADAVLTYAIIGYRGTERPVGGQGTVGCRDGTGSDHTAGSGGHGLHEPASRGHHRGRLPASISRARTSRRRRACCNGSTGACRVLTIKQQRIAWLPHHRAHPRRQLVL